MARHKLCAGCTAAGTNYVFMTDIGAYMCDCCIDQHLSANYCDCCSVEATNLAYSKVMRGSVCEKCELILETETKHADI